jgi:type VI secretion system protein ImpG
MSTRRYFDEEMRYLQEAGAAFAEAHPEAARYLGAASVADRDPYVERLFEGFAFLTGRVRERLDDEFPRVTEGLFELLFPHMLRPVPSCAVVELAPRPGLVQEPVVLPRGTPVLSGPVGPEETACRFQTTHDVRLLPLRVAGAAVEWAGAESRLRLALDVERGATLTAGALDGLRLTFNAEAPVAAALHLHLTRHVRSVSLVVDGEVVGRLAGQAAVRPAGLGEGEALLPYDARSFAGFRLLHEYLSFRRKFWAVDVVGLGAFELPERPDRVEVVVEWDRAFPDDRRVTAQNVRLHCAPVVNVFDTDAEPVAVDGTTAEVRVVPDAARPRSVEALDVLGVVGVEDETGRRHVYAPFYAFGERAPRHYVASRRPGPFGLPEMTLTLGGEPGAGGVATPETLSIRLRCTNGTLPREALREGGLDRLGPGVPQVAVPTNLTRPTPTLRPPAGGEGSVWPLVSHWALAHRSVATREALTELLGLYDWTADEANRRRIAGVRAVAVAPEETFRRGGVLRGSRVTVDVDGAHFGDEGEVALFGLVLSEFLALYATLNAFVRTDLVVRPSERRLSWAPERGRLPVV